MVNFEELENKICQSRGNYSLADDGRRKNYTIFSDELKQSLRDIIHSTAREGEWQISHSLGADYVEYRKKQGEKFGFYQKCLREDCADEFSVLSERESSTEKEKFEENRRVVEESRRAVEHSRHAVEQSKYAVENARKAVEDSRKIAERDQQFNRDNSYISFITGRNEETGAIENSVVENYTDPSQERAIKESWGYKALGRAFEILKDKKTSESYQSGSSQNQQTQVRQIEQVKQNFFQYPKKS
jgi:hypothetical protein